MSVNQKKLIKRIAQKINQKDEVVEEIVMSRYSQDWREIAIAVKEKANWKCNNCGADFKNKSSRGNCLQVHHWNRIPEDNRPENLVALCNTCHLEYHRGRKGNILVGQLSLNL